MLRRLGWVLPPAILAALAGVGFTYFTQRQQQALSAPPKPKPLPIGISSQSGKWEWANNEGNRPKVLIRASGFKELREPPSVDLTGLELLLYDATGKSYDLVTSDTARFSKDDRTLFAEGAVHITMGLPEGEPPPNRVLEIEGSAVRFELDTNKAMSEKEVRFKFGQGSGRATGAEYDPNTKDLRLKKDVFLTWADADPKKTMQIEAGEAVYKENESKVYLSPWSKLRRGTLTMTGANATILLEQGTVRHVDAEKASGFDQQPKRRLEFAADAMALDFTAKGAAEKIAGQGSARLVTVAETARTVMTSDRVDLSFLAAQSTSTLEKAFAQGRARVESAPLAKVAQPGETKVLSSEVIELRMRPGGEEIEQMETHAPGRIELLPNRPGQRKRTLDGERLSVTYGPRNQADALRAVKVATRTEPDPARPGGAAALTWSQDLLAKFAPETGDLQKLEQWTNFRYREGDRQAVAERALLEQPANAITLTGKSRVWDPTGSTDADRILLDQKSGDFTALGNVRTIREPEKKPGAASTQLVSKEEPVRATADKMTSTDRNRYVRYDGRAVLWQGGNRLTAQRIDIHRNEQTLEAFGQVVSQLFDKETAGKAATFTVVRAPELVYSDKEKLAHYRGGAFLTRPGLQVKGQEIRAYLAEENSEVLNEGPSSGLEKAFAVGQVEIVDKREERTRQGWGEQAEYLVTDNRLTLDGPGSRMVDLVRGVPQRRAQGKQLVWIAQEERLLVDGEEQQRAASTLRRKK